MSRVSTPPTTRPTPPTQASPPTSTTSTSVPREKIAMRAYEKWLKSGCRHGCDQQHWLEAEAEIRAEMARSTRR